MNWGHGGAAGRLSVSRTTPGINITLLSTRPRYLCAPTSTGTAPIFQTPPRHHIPTPQASTINLTAHGGKLRQRETVSNPRCAGRCWQRKALKSHLRWPLHCSFCSFLQPNEIPNAIWFTCTAQLRHTLLQSTLYIHKEQLLLWRFSPASPKAQLTQDRNERLLVHHQSHWMHRKCKTQTRRIVQRNTIQEMLWFVWLWSNSPAQPSDKVSSAFIVNQFCPIPRLHTSWISTVPRWGQQELSAL